MQWSDDCGLSVNFNLHHHYKQHQLKISVFTSEVTKTKIDLIQILYSCVKLVTQTPWVGRGRNLTDPDKGCEMLLEESLLFS